MSSWYVYMILTDKFNLYTGITTDVARRLREHADVAAGIHPPKGAKFFRTQKPLRVVYCAVFPDRAAASRRERAIKKMTRLQKHQLVASTGSTEFILSAPSAIPAHYQNE